MAFQPTWYLGTIGLAFQEMFSVSSWAVMGETVVKTSTKSAEDRSTQYL